MGAHQKITDQPLTSQIQLIRLQLKFMWRQNHQIKIKHRAQARETNYDMVKVSLISAGLVLAFLIHHFLFWNHSTMNIATPRIRSHAFWLRKLITDSAALDMKPMIKLIRLGRIAANLPPRVLKPSQTPLATDIRPFPTAKTTAEIVRPYFLNMFLIFSWRDKSR